MTISVAWKTLNNGAVRLRWMSSDDVSGITGYNLVRNGAILATNLPDTTYLDDTVTNGVAYTYTVTAIDQVGNIGTATGATVTP